MNIIAKRTLLKFIEKHKDAEQPLLSWHAEVKKSIWEMPSDILRSYNSADIINSKRVVFNIKGNHYRLIVDIEYKIKTVFIVKILTHAEYSKVKIEDLDYED